MLRLEAVAPEPPPFIGETGGCPGLFARTGPLRLADFSRQVVADGKLGQIRLQRAVQEIWHASDHWVPVAAILCPQHSLAHLIAIAVEDTKIENASPPSTYAAQMPHRFLPHRSTSLSTAMFRQEAVAALVFASRPPKNSNCSHQLSRLSIDQIKTTLLARRMK